MYYIYAYLREDGTPYYIGKGSRKRAYSKEHNVVVPDKNRIIIMEDNLTEVGALALERFYIRWYGRKDNNTGVLYNRTDGGDGGNTGISDAARKRLSESRKSIPLKWKEKLKGKRPHVDQSGSKNNNAKSIFTPYGKYGSIRDASIALNMKYKNLYYKIVNKDGWGYL